MRCAVVNELHGASKKAQKTQKNGLTQRRQGAKIDEATKKHKNRKSLELNLVKSIVDGH